MRPLQYSLASTRRSKLEDRLNRSLEQDILLLSIRPDSDCRFEVCILAEAKVLLQLSQRTRLNSAIGINEVMRRPPED